MKGQHENRCPFFIFDTLANQKRPDYGIKT